MAINLEKKQAIVTKISEIANNSLSVVIADSSGITANKMNELRKLARQNNVYISGTRNTLLRIIIRNTKFKCLIDCLTGSCLIGFSTAHAGTAARLFKNFSKINSQFILKSAAYEGKILTGGQIELLASLPTAEEALILLIITMKEAAIGRLVRTINIYCKSKSTM
ncbi:MAG: 50S ribosomal protein L10 [Candidatus Dasytiphilus stammeri]